jgi:hypothetical protein
MGSFNIDVDFDDIIGSMSKYDRKQFFKEMQNEGYISEFCEITNDGEVQAAPHIEKKAIDESTDDFNQALQSLWNNGWKLTKEQEDYVIELAKRFK